VWFPFAEGNLSGNEVAFALDPNKPLGSYPANSFWECSAQYKSEAGACLPNSYQFPDAVVNSMLDARPNAGCFLGEPSIFSWCAGMASGGGFKKADGTVKLPTELPDTLGDGHGDARGCSGGLARNVARLNMLVARGLVPSRLMVAPYMMSWGGRTRPGADASWTVPLMNGLGQGGNPSNRQNMTLFPTDWNPVLANVPNEEFDWFDRQTAQVMLACTDWWLYALKGQHPEIGRVMLQASNGNGANMGPGDQYWSNGALQSVWKAVADLERKYSYPAEIQIEGYNCNRARSEGRYCPIQAWSKFIDREAELSYPDTNFPEQSVFPECRVYNGILSGNPDGFHLFGGDYLTRNYPTAAQPNPMPSPAALRTLMTLCPLDSALNTSRTYYVAPNGSDSNTGILGSPWRTIQKAADSVRSGDRVFIEPGTYAEKVIFSKGGTTARGELGRVIFSATPGGRVIVDGATLPMTPSEALFTVTGSIGYVTLENFTLKNSKGYGVWVDGNATHIELRGLDISKTQGDAAIFLTDTAPVTNKKYDRIANNKIHDNDRGGIVVWSSSQGHILIEENEVWNNAGGRNIDAIQVGSMSSGTHHVVVRKNKLWNNSGSFVYNEYADQIDVGGHVDEDPNKQSSPNHHILVEDNDVFYTDDWVAAGYNTRPSKVHGLSRRVNGQLTDETYAQIFRFNRLTYSGLEFYDHPNSATIYNNTVVNGQVQLTTDVKIPDGYGASYGSARYGTLRLLNNLFWGSYKAPGNTSAYLLLTYRQYPSESRLDTRYAESVGLFSNLWRFSPGTGRGILWQDSIFDAQTSLQQFNAWRAVDGQEPGSALKWLDPATHTLEAVFEDVDRTNPNRRAYRPKVGSILANKGAILTTTRAAGSSQTVIPVERSSYFHDSYNGMIVADQVRIGDQVRKVVAVSEQRPATITVDSPVSYSSGAHVTLPYRGSAPDIGAVERE
jgi:hypothetical protein